MKLKANFILTPSPSDGIMTVDGGIGDQNE